MDGCGDCAGTVCFYDSDCCNTAWDALCVIEANEFCSNICACAGGQPHGVCVQGVPLIDGCGDCADAVCDHDSFCCNNGWDGFCVNEANQFCNNVCGCAGGQPHSECVAGGPLIDGCVDCANAVCFYEPSCCIFAWSGVCVNKANLYCNNVCGCAGGQPHFECFTGGPLIDGCGDCADTVCYYDSYCCNNAWDGICVNKANQYCGNVCGCAGGQPHDVCAQGGPLIDGCGDCADTVCFYDPYCCTSGWDAICVDEANNLFCAGICG